MSNFKKQYLLGGVIDRGPRFCSKNLHFLVRNKMYLPYSYFISVLLDNNKGKDLTKNTYDP